jgi:hypothetical protein
MKKENENQTDRLAELLGTVDSALLDEALKTDTPEALAALAGKNIPAVPQRPRVWTRSRVHALVASAAVVVALPITLLFLWLQKYYVQGVTGGAVKG